MRYHFKVCRGLDGKRNAAEEQDTGRLQYDGVRNADDMVRTQGRPVAGACYEYKGIFG